MMKSGKKGIEKKKEKKKKMIDESHKELKREINGI